MCFWKSDLVFRFFCRGVFIGEGAASEVDQVGLTIGQRGMARAWAAPLVVRPPDGSVLSPLRSSGSFVKYLDVRLLFHPIPRIFPM
jgi:hypothetical protein